MPSVINAMDSDADDAPVHPRTRAIARIGSQWNLAIEDVCVNIPFAIENILVAIEKIIVANEKRLRES